MAKLIRLSFPLSADRKLDVDFVNILGVNSNDGWRCEPDKKYPDPTSWPLSLDRNQGMISGECPPKLPIRPASPVFPI